jgi:hypothetical protein
MLKVSEILNSVGHTIGFTTEYPQHSYIEKTVAFCYCRNENSEILEMGKLTVYMRDGTSHSFDCWVSAAYCGQFGINVSDDGSRIYVISDEKGLWCYSYDGKILWKTKYTSVGDVIVNSNGTITCITSTKIIQLDENGKTINSRKILPYHACKASENIIYIAISCSKVALVDSETMDIIWEASIRKMNLDDSRDAIIYENILIISGLRESRILYVPIELPDTVIENCRHDESLSKNTGFCGFIKMMEHSKNVK